MGRPPNPRPDIAPEAEFAPAAPADSMEARLVAHGFGDLPEVFAMRDEGNAVIQERGACYFCRADGFYGRGREGTWYAEGSIIVTDEVPNEHMEPLNRAAATKYVQWLSRLPNNRAPIDIGDMSEAAHMLAKDPMVTALSPADYQRAVIKLSEELKFKREGKDARTLPSLGHNFTSASGGNAPPILGAKTSDMAQRRPGETRIPDGVPAGHVAGTRRGVADLGGILQQR